MSYGKCLLEIFSSSLLRPKSKSPQMEWFSMALQEQVKLRSRKGCQNWLGFIWLMKESLQLIFQLLMLGRRKECLKALLTEQEFLLTSNVQSVLTKLTVSSLIEKTKRKENRTQREFLSSFLWLEETKLFLTSYSSPQQTTWRKLIRRCWEGLAANIRWEGLRLKTEKI